MKCRKNEVKNISSSGSKSAPWNQGRQPASILESVPPHPYLNGGRKIAFYRRLNYILRAIPEEGLSPSPTSGIVFAKGSKHDRGNFPLTAAYLTGPRFGNLSERK